MGIYCIAAGSGSANRLKTLDRPHSVADIEPFLSSRDVQRLREHFPDGHSVFLWGANQQGGLPRVRAENYVIDFNNQRVDNIFRFCFFTELDGRLQRFVRWDEGHRSTSERRPYPYVYFLKNPLRPRNRDKQFFLRAFGAERKPHFFDGQKYLDDDAIAEALRRIRMNSVEAFLGLPPGSGEAEEFVKHQGALTGSHTSSTTNTQTEQVTAHAPQPQSATPADGCAAPPDWLLPVITTVQRLWAKRDSLEREHEHVVAQFFEALGYQPAEEIRFQRANIDIVITQEGRTLAVIEVKADRALGSVHRSVLGQAFGYALEAGAPILIITNGNYYAVYDRRRGLSREECMLGELRLLSLDSLSLTVIAKLRKGVLK